MVYCTKNSLILTSWTLGSQDLNVLSNSQQIAIFSTSISISPLNSPLAMMTLPNKNFWPTINSPSIYKKRLAGNFSTSCNKKLHTQNFTILFFSLLILNFLSYHSHFNTQPQLSASTSFFPTYYPFPKAPKKTALYTLSCRTSFEILQPVFFFEFPFP